MSPLKLCSVAGGCSSQPTTDMHGLVPDGGALCLHSSQGRSPSSSTIATVYVATRANAKANNFSCVAICAAGDRFHTIISALGVRPLDRRFGQETLSTPEWIELSSVANLDRSGTAEITHLLMSIIWLVSGEAGKTT